MKSPAAYYLLLIYLFALCKPVMPLIQDVVAHTFFEHQHLATVHQHSSSHVKEEVGKMADSGSAQENTSSIKSFDSVPLHTASTCLFHFSSEKPVTITHHSYYRYGLPSLSLSIQLPPPRA